MDIFLIPRMLLVEVSVYFVAFALASIIFFHWQNGLLHRSLFSRFEICSGLFKDL